MQRITKCQARLCRLDASPIETVLELPNVELEIQLCAGHRELAENDIRQLELAAE